MIQTSVKADQLGDEEGVDPTQIWTQLKKSNVKNGLSNISNGGCVVSDLEINVHAHN